MFSSRPKVPKSWAKFPSPKTCEPAALCPGWWEQPPFLGLGSCGAQKIVSQAQCWPQPRLLCNCRTPGSPTVQRCPPPSPGCLLNSSYLSPSDPLLSSFTQVSKAPPCSLPAEGLGILSGKRAGQREAPRRFRCTGVIVFAS